MTSHEEPKHILLLGAGFSRNWGGWLVSEVNEYLLGYPLFDKSLRQLLWDQLAKGGNFETLLEKLQSNSASSGLLSILKLALRMMFDHMDKGFQSRNFDFDGSHKTSVSQFLSRFDAIFTLNQDLLLERHYLSQHQVILEGSKWHHFFLPGMVQQNYDRRAWGGLGYLEPSRLPYQLHDGWQPYFKLHGSANWKPQGTDGLSQMHSEFIIMGGNKSTTLENIPLLDAYIKEFRSRLLEPGAKLMIIGYSFGDVHINDAILKGIRQASLRTFLLDPKGSELLRKDKCEKREEYDTQHFDLWNSLIGVSQRSLRDIFTTDSVEYEKVMRFFDPKPLPPSSARSSASAATTSRA